MEHKSENWLLSDISNDLALAPDLPLCTEDWDNLDNLQMHTHTACRFPPTLSGKRRKSGKVSPEGQRQRGTRIARVHWEWSPDPALRFMSPPPTPSIHSFFHCLNCVPTSRRRRQPLPRHMQTTHRVLWRSDGHLCGVQRGTEHGVIKHPSRQAQRKGC